MYFCNAVPPPCFTTRSSDPPANYDHRSPILRAGDRVGVCLSSLDAKLLERGVLTTPGSLKALTAAVALVRKVSVYNSDSAGKRLQPGQADWMGALASVPDFPLQPYSTVAL